MYISLRVERHIAIDDDGLFIATEIAPRDRDAKYRQSSRDVETPKGDDIQ